MAVKTVSLVPRLMTAVPGLLAPMPMRLLGLSPVKAMTLVPAVKPYFLTK